MIPWLVFATKPGADRRSMADLKELGYSAYAPMETIWRGRFSQRSVMERPLIPGYVFAQAPAHVIHEVDGLRGVVRTAAYIDVDQFVAEMEKAEGEGAFDRTHGRGRKLKIGDRVKVRAGRWQGIVGELRRLDGKSRAQIVTKFFGGAPLRVEVDQLEAA